MATREQWEVFKCFHDEENDRYHSLNNKGKVYLTLIMLYLGAVALKVASPPDLPQSNTVILLFALAVFCFLIALCVSVVALGVYTYERIADPEDVIKGFGNKPPTNEDFYDDRIVDVSVATNRNHIQNNRRARLLSVASFLMVAGILSHMTYFAYQTFGEGRHESCSKEEGQQEEGCKEAGRIWPPHGDEAQEKEVLAEEEGGKEKEEIGKVTTNTSPTPGN